MRLGLKLAAFVVILLLPKTHLYLSKGDHSEAQTAPERPIPGPAAPWDVGDLTISAEGKQTKSSTCAPKPEHDTAAVHTMDKRPQGS